MTVRATSIDAYNKIRENGMLAEKQMELYEVLFHHGPLTANEVFLKFKAKRGKHYAIDAQYRSKLHALREKGVVAEVGIVQDPLSGMHVIQWDVTDRLPAKPEKKPTLKQRLVEANAKIAMLEMRIANLEMDLANCKGET